MCVCVQVGMRQATDASSGYPLPLTVCTVQVGMRVLNTGFDEGADVHEFEHWKE